MPSAILNSPNWYRTAEILYRGQEYTGELLNASYTTAANPILPGQVVVLVNGRISLADQSLDTGAFTGLMYTEFSSTIDETNGNTIAPVIIRGPGTVRVWNAALTGPFSLSGSAVIELVAVSGKLKARAAETGPTVATLTQVLSDSIIVQLNAPDTPGE